MAISLSRINLFLALSMILVVSSFAQGDDPVEAWVSLFCGPGGGYDSIYDMAVDKAGIVYVTGYVNDLRYDNIATIKYEPSLTEDGAEQDSQPGPQVY